MTDHERDELETRLANALDVPEPSPLFWKHFPERVRAAVASSPVAAVPWWRRGAFALAMSVAAAAALSAWVLVRATPPVINDDGIATDTLAPPVSLDAGIEGEDAGWQVVGAVAESAGIEAVREAGFGIAPGGAEAAIDDMTEAERAELVTLLRAEMNGDDGGL